MQQPPPEAAASNPASPVAAAAAAPRAAGKQRPKPYHRLTVKERKDIVAYLVGEGADKTSATLRRRLPAQAGRDLKRDPSIIKKVWKLYTSDSLPDFEPAKKTTSTKWAVEVAVGYARLTAEQRRNDWVVAKRLKLPYKEWMDVFKARIEAAFSIPDDLYVVDTVNTREDRASIKKQAKFIKMAKATLEMQLFCLTEKKLCNAIIAVKRKGAAVRVLLDKKEARAPAGVIAVEKLRKAGVELRFYKGVMLHTKIFFVDGVAMYDGSGCLSEAAHNKNLEDLNYMVGPQLAVRRARFEKLYEDEALTDDEFQKWAKGKKPVKKRPFGSR